MGVPESNIPQLWTWRRIGISTPHRCPLPMIDPSLKTGEVCDCGAAMLTGSKTLASCLLWFLIVWCFVGESGLTWYSSSDPLASSSVSSTFRRALSFWAMTFLDGVVDIPPWVKFNFGGMAHAEWMIVPNDYERNHRNEVKWKKVSHWVIVIFVLWWGIYGPWKILLPVRPYRRK